jgi:hypothetical protein
MDGFLRKDLNVEDNFKLIVSTEAKHYAGQSRLPADSSEQPAQTILRHCDPNRPSFVIVCNIS